MKRYVLVEMSEPAYAVDDAALVRDRLRGFGGAVRTADVTEWVEEVGGDLYLDTPKLELS